MPLKDSELTGMRLVLVHNHILLRLIEDSPRSYGDHSKFTRAIRYKYEEEEASINQMTPASGPKARFGLRDFIGIIKGEIAEAQYRLSRWAGIPVNAEW